MITTQGLRGYSRFPERLKRLKPELSAMEGPDVFGVLPRLNVLTKFWADGGGTAADLGGHSGFFSLSLVDAGLLSRSTVYDVDDNSLDAGRQMAREMGLADKVIFKKQSISLEWLRSLEKVDNILCLNLIHHAGLSFDVERVRENGWEEYANAWLATMRQLSNRCAVGVGFKGRKPAYWDVPARARPKRFFEMSVLQNWKVVYDGNVDDIVNLGIERANGWRTSGGGMEDEYADSFFSRLRSNVGRKLEHLTAKNSPFRMRREKYHLYLLG